MRIDQRINRVTDLYLFSEEKDIDKVDLDTKDVEVMLDIVIETGEVKRENNRLLEALREIDIHIRSTSEPIPHIINTLKTALPEYSSVEGEGSK